MKPLLEGLKSLGVARLGAMGAVALGILAMLAVLVGQSSGHKPMALLYGDLDTHDIGQIADQLDKAHIAHTLGSGGDQIMVPADQVAAARLLLAKSGLPAGGSVGYEIFDRGDNLTATQFQQSINETRALEGELTRSIRLISGVKAARVHLVLPHREPFASEAMPAQASVLLSMQGAARLDPEGVQAVINLVAAAVPGLRPENVAIVDNRGTVLARAGSPVDGSGASQSTEERRQATELRLARAVEEMLEPSLGADHVRAEAAVTMDMNQIRETQESYDPNQQVLRSQQTTTDKSRNTESNTNTSVQNNLPNADAGAPQNGSQEDREEETNNYEIGKTVRTLIQDQPRIARVSLAVMVDGTTTIGPDGKPIWKARAPEELDRISTLVKSAIGFDAKRGDTVSVVSMPFVTEVPAETPAPAGLLGFHFSHDEALHAGENVLLGLFLLLALVFVVRPMLTRAGESAALAAVPGAAGALAGAGAGAIGANAALAGLPALSGPNAAGTMALIEDESMVSIANIEGRLKASSIRQIVELVEKHPEESLTIVRSWLSQEQPT